jgi:putative transposase
MLGGLGDLYHTAVQQRIEAYRRRGITLRYNNQALELNAVRQAAERLGGCSLPVEQVLRRLGKTSCAFLARGKRAARPGFPRYRAKSRFDRPEFAGSA